MNQKEEGLFFNGILYVIAFSFGLIPFMFIDNIIFANFAFTMVATLVIFIATCIYPDTSLYDPYWSVAPPVMILISMIKYGLWNANAIIVFIVIMIWATRLTLNWAYTYKGLGHEDWRYAKYRANNSKIMFAIINFFGLQYIPTVLVFLGLIPALFILQLPNFSFWIIPGLLITLGGVVLEYLSDTSIHKFIKDENNKGKTCNISLWKYSRHPNYLGELSVWTGIFVSFVSVRYDIWYFGLGFILIICLFLFISIPLMEKHNLERREDYIEYKKKTSMLIPLPNKK